MTKPTVDLGYPTEARGKIPPFKSIEEEAAFWDTHDFSDFMEESDLVTITVGGELAARMTIRLDQADRVALNRHAREKGVGPSTLARIWIKERLSEEKKARKAS